MKTFATKEKRSVPAARKARPYVHHPMGPAQQAQQAEIRRILHSPGAQAKLTIGQPNDEYEQDADRVADQVMAMPDPRLQRQPEAEEEEETLQAKPLADQITPLVQRQEEPPEGDEEPVQAKFKDSEMIQRMCPECEEETAQRQPMEEEEEELQTKSTSGESPSVTPTPSLESRINILKDGGQSLDPVTRAFFESRFGYNLSHVRVHSDSTAENIAQCINARAFTLGNHVVMGSGEYYPNLHSGQRLLAHELTHVVQQSSGRHAGAMQRLVRGDVTKQSINPAWAWVLTNQELHDQIYLLRGHLEGLSVADSERAAVLGNLEVLEQEVLDRQAPAGPTSDRLVNEWLGLSAGQHLSSERAWIRGQWPVGGNLATLNATFRVGVQALLNFVATTPTAQFNIISYARSAPKQHVMHVSQYIRKGWMGYVRYKFSRWPGVLAARGRTNLLALPSHERRS
ncbi:MAG: eCIS core domain-containing protein, partial [Planctomycetota bacterium]